MAISSYVSRLLNCILLLSTLVHLCQVVSTISSSASTVASNSSTSAFTTTSVEDVIFDQGAAGKTSGTVITFTEVAIGITDHSYYYYTLTYTRTMPLPTAGSGTDHPTTTKNDPDFGLTAVPTGDTAAGTDQVAPRNVEHWIFATAIQAVSSMEEIFPAAKAVEAGPLHLSNSVAYADRSLPIPNPDVGDLNIQNDRNHATDSSIPIYFRWAITCGQKDNDTWIRDCWDSVFTSNSTSRGENESQHDDDSHGADSRSLEVDEDYVDERNLDSRREKPQQLTGKTCQQICWCDCHGHVICPYTWGKCREGDLSSACKILGDCGCDWQYFTRQPLETGEAGIPEPFSESSICSLG